MSTNGTPVQPEEVARVWRVSDLSRADGKGTFGIFLWVAPFVDRWERFAITSADLEDLRVIGGEPDGGWAELTNGTFRLASIRREELKSQAPVNLVCVHESQRGRRVILDGNHRAVALLHAVRAGREVPKGSVLYVGFLHPTFVAAAAAVSSIWR